VNDTQMLARILARVEAMESNQEELIRLLGGRLERSTAETDARFPGACQAHQGRERGTGGLAYPNPYPVASSRSRNKNN